MELHDNIAAKGSVWPAAIGATGTGQIGKVIDRSGFQGVELIASYGVVVATNATLTPAIYEGDVTGTMTLAPAASLLGSGANAGIGQAATRTSGVSSKVTKRFGYIGFKRYVQARINSTVTAGVVVAASFILSDPRTAPVAT